jgi:hypothetical protein
MDAPQDTLVSKFAPKAFLVRLGIGVLILNLFVILMTAVSLRQSWRNHQDLAIASAQNLAQVLDRYVADTFSKADLAVWAVKDEIERLDTGAAVGRRDLDAFIRRQHQRAPGLLALRTTDAQGVINHGGGAEMTAVVSLADREHFIRLRDVPDAGLVISKPVVGKLTGTWVIILARRLERPDHSFAGMVYAVIGLDQFDKVFSTLDVGPHGSVALRDLDLGLIARYPQPTSAGTAIGQKVVSRELLAFAQSGQDTGIYRARTPFDQVQRTFSIRRVSDRPFYLLVGLAERDYLSGWRREVIKQLAEVGLFIGLTLVTFWLIRRAWLRQQTTHENLERLLAEVKTLGGMLPICSHCKKIRDDNGYWNQLEAYLNAHTDAEFTHGICPDCAKEIFPRASGKHTTM